MSSPTEANLDFLEYVKGASMTSSSEVAEALKSVSLEALGAAFRRHQAQERIAAAKERDHLSPLSPLPADRPDAPMRNVEKVRSHLNRTLEEQGKEGLTLERHWLPFIDKLITLGTEYKLSHKQMRASIIFFSDINAKDSIKRDLTDMSFPEAMEHFINLYCDIPTRDAKMLEMQDWTLDTKEPEISLHRYRNHLVTTLTDKDGNPPDGRTITFAICAKIPADLRSEVLHFMTTSRMPDGDPQTMIDVISMFINGN